MNKVVVYTAAFGENYGFIPQNKIEGIDFVCFTDSIKKVPKPWKSILFKKEGLSDHLRNRFVKLLPHKVLSEYEISIYIDSNYLVVGDLNRLLEEVSSFKMAIFDHNQCDDARDCLYDEYQAILKLGKQRGVYKDDPKIMEQQMAFFKSENYPEHNGLIFAAVLLRKHNDSDVVRLMEGWWKIVSTMSKRDQLSFNYVAWKQNFKPTILNGDLRKYNPYFYFLASARKSYTSRLIKYKLKKFFGFIKHPKSSEL